MIFNRQFQILAVVFLSCSAALVPARERPRGNGTDNAPAVSANGADALALAEYEVLFAHNIFSREQPKKKREAGPPPIEKTGEQVLEDKAARDKEAAIRGDAEIVLMGLVIRDEQRFAILEDRRGGKKITVRPGEALGSGKAGEVTIDTLEFVTVDKSSPISIGSNLNGKVAVPRAAETSGGGGGGSAAPGSATAGGTVPGTVGPDGVAVPGTAGSDGAGTGAAAGVAPGAGSAADDSNLSVIEKMRRKRQKESNQ